MITAEGIEGRIAEVYSRDASKVFATLVRLLGDFDLAEEAMQEAFATALEAWRVDGIPRNPAAWLVSTARFRGIDTLRRRARQQALEPDIKRHLEELERAGPDDPDGEIEDDRLRLIFTCCHPAIEPKVQVPLTLREICGLTTEEIASAFLTSPAAMAQRIVRGKAKIRAARIPYAIPSRGEIQDRLDAVLSVIYLIFNEGYHASAGDSVLRHELTEEAIRLARLLLELLPDPEVMGLLALMLLHESRRSSRVSPAGEPILLEQQDRALWDRRMIAEGSGLVNRALQTREIGAYTVQASISAIHAAAPSTAETDWARIAGLYSLLNQISPSPVVELNRAVAVAFSEGTSAGIALIRGILERGELTEYHLAHAALGELYRRSGDPENARESLLRALELARQEPERRLLQKRLEELAALAAPE